MRIEMPERAFEAYRQPYIDMFGYRAKPTLYGGVSALFRDCGHRGEVEVVSVYRGWVEIEVTGALPACFSTDGQAHGTVFYRKVG